MIVSVHQPQYIPWLGYFDKIARSDGFVFLDCVQYKAREFQNRNKLRRKGGWMWLSVPVVSPEHGRLMINRVLVDNQSDWRRTHAGSLRAWYGGTPFFKDYFPFFEDVYSRDWERLADLNVAIIKYLLNCFSISTPVMFESDLKVDATSTRRIIEICKALKANGYLSGSGGRDYLEERMFPENGIQLLYQEYTHPVYAQRYEPFLPYMSAIDLLFNHGKDAGRILLNQGETKR